MRKHKLWLGTCALTVGLTGPLGAQVPPLTAPKPGAPSSSEIEIVERVLLGRRDYQASLEQLRAYYGKIGDMEKARWAEEELRQYHRISKQAYRLELDVPPPTLHANENVPEANELFRRAMTFKDKGMSWATWNNEYADNQRRAEILFQQLLTQYPQSDKIDDAAYQLGDIYEGKAYRQPKRAAQYYERCFQWNPNTQYDARIRAARIYDRELMERSEAMRLYREVLSHETDPKRMQEAKKRLGDLSGGK